MQHWINFTYSGDSLVDLAEVYDINSHMQTGSVEIDLRGKGTSGTTVSKGDVVYIAVVGEYNGEKSTRIIAKGFVDTIGKNPNSGVPSVIFIKGTFTYIDTPMINGLNIDRFTKDNRSGETPHQAAYYRIEPHQANYIDTNVFYGNKSV